MLRPSNSRPSQPACVQAHAKGQQINPKGHEMMDERGTEEKVLIVKSVFSFWTPLESLNVETKPCEKFSGVIPLQLNSQQ